MADEAARKTKYLVLYSRNGSTWEINGELESTGSDNAIRQHTRDMTEVAGHWAAVPERSFQPKKITPKVVTQHVLEDVARPGLQPTTQAPLVT